MRWRSWAVESPKKTADSEIGKLFEDDYSDNAIRALTIGGVTFAGFSFSFFDEAQD